MHVHANHAPGRRREGEPVALVSEQVLQREGTVPASPRKQDSKLLRDHSLQLLNRESRSCSLRQLSIPPLS